MKKFIEFLSKIEKDKLLHYCYSQWIFAIMYWLLLLTSLPKWFCITFAALVSLGLMIYKEVWDGKGNGDKEIKDVLSGVLGILILIVMVIL